MTQIFNLYRNINRRIKNSLPDLFESIEPRSLFEALEGPHDKSLGLPIKRYDSESLLAALKSYNASNWVEVNAATWDHKTPSGGEQKFQYLLAQRL